MPCRPRDRSEDRKSTRLNSSHSQISYAVFCLKKKKNKKTTDTHTSHHPTMPHTPCNIHIPSTRAALLQVCYELCFFCFYFIVSHLISLVFCFFFFNDTATTEIYTLSLHDALPICCRRR